MSSQKMWKQRRAVRIELISQRKSGQGLDVVYASIYGTCRAHLLVDGKQIAVCIRSSGKMKLRPSNETIERPTDNPRMAECAFSLIEVMCSAAIVGIVFTALFFGLSEGFSMIQTAREGLRATQIGLSRMEDLRLEGWSSNELFNPVLVPTNFTDSFYPLGLEGSTSSTGTVYSGTMTIQTGPFTSSSLVPSYNSNMALVTVIVSWHDVEGGHTNTFTRTNYTYVAKYGMQNYIYAQ